MQVSAPRLKEFSPQELFCLCWSFATFRHSSEPLGIAAAAELKERHSEFGSLELSGMIWSLARILCPEQDTFASSNPTSARSQTASKKSPVENRIRMQGGIIESAPQKIEEESLLEGFTEFNNEVPAAAVAASWILSIENREEISDKIDSMEASQVAMTVWGLGRLTRAFESYPDSLTQKRPNASTLEALRKALTRVAPELSVSSLVATAEGLARLGIVEDKISAEESEVVLLESSWSGVLEALGNRAIKVNGSLRPWEFSSLAFFLSQVGEIAATRELFEKQVEVWNEGFKLSPKGSILLLGAMARSRTWPWPLFVAARSQLVRLSSSYSLESWYLEVLHDALEELQQQHGLEVKLPKQWQKRVQAIGDAITYAKER